MFKLRSFVSVAFVLAASFGQSFAKDDRWFFTANEMADAYRYQQQFGAQRRIDASRLEENISVPCCHRMCYGCHAGC